MQSRRAGWAVVTLDSDGELCQINYGAVPLSASTHQTARDAEDMVLAVVLGQVDGTGHHCACYGPKTGIRISKGYSSSHMWINQDLAVHLRLHKVKAHQRFNVHMTSEQRRDAKGNATADTYAKKGALEHVRGGQYQFDRYNEMLDTHTKALLHAVEVDYRMWKDNVTDHVPVRRAGYGKQDECDSSSRGRKRGVGSKIAKWEPPGWLLLLSNRALVYTAPVDLTERMEIVPECVPVLTHVLKNYDVWHLGEWHGSLTACDRCGAYATSTPRLLGKLCEGDPTISGRNGLRQQLKRIRAGHHPRGGALLVSLAVDG
eukprot:5610666-Amphidinium_carterae.1